MRHDFPRLQLLVVLRALPGVGCRLKLSLRQVHVAGEKLFVDYSGHTMEVIDGQDLAQRREAVLMSDTNDRHFGTEGASDTAAPMRLRGDPPRVTRLSRKALAGIGLVASIGLGGALIYALQTRDAGPRNEELYSTTNRPTADGLAGLPRDYTGPRLGPPLPGDLGRPILNAQDRGQPVVPPS